MTCADPMFSLDGPVPSDATFFGGTRAGWSYIARVRCDGDYHVSVQMIEASGAYYGKIERSIAVFATEKTAREHAQILAMKLTPFPF